MEKQCPKCESSHLLIDRTFRPLPQGRCMSCNYISILSSFDKQDKPSVESFEDWFHSLINSYMGVVEGIHPLNSPIKRKILNDLKSAIKASYLKNMGEKDDRTAKVKKL